MQYSLKVVVLVTVVTCFMGCTKSNMRQIVESAIADGADTQVKYTASECRILQQRCV
jgi:hypothetical protein